VREDEEEEEKQSLKLEFISTKKMTSGREGRKQAVVGLFRNPRPESKIYS
jgi:hypothetical protein